MVSKNTQLPNLQNLGILLRILVGVNVLTMLAAVLISAQLHAFVSILTELSTVVQPVLLLSIFVLYLLYPLLKKRSYWQSVVIILGVVTVIAALISALFTQFFFFEFNTAVYRTTILSIATAAAMLYYFELRQRAYSPAITEARLQALQARIRPHFLFNSINAVLSLIRSQPKRAETALEDMADLFRVLMAENRDLVPLEKEIALCKQYLHIENLRMEERLRVNWQVDDIPEHALVPPLILQPLIENAVYHGIEPIAEGGEITVVITYIANELRIKMSNPYRANSNHHTGNKMALNNIKERLALHFDLEASILHQIKNGQYVVSIRIPYVTP
jgi:two-component system, LytTR family, sensor histidine kinase AlgZ